MKAKKSILEKENLLATSEVATKPLHHHSMGGKKTPAAKSFEAPANLEGYQEWSASKTYQYLENLKRYLQYLGCSLHTYRQACIVHKRHLKLQLREC